MEAVQQFLQAHAANDLLPWPSQVAATVQFGLSHAKVEGLALALGLLPARYQRNRQAISVKQQLMLFRSRVAILGCGGLGGYVVEQLARLGVGNLVAIDPDVFEEHNLNRQLLSSPQTLGSAKVACAAARVAEINPAVTLIPVRAAYAADNGHQLLAGAQVVVDALDSIDTRLALVKTCAELGVPLVHGAIAGWYGQVITQFPGDDTIQKLYSRQTRGKGIEQQLGNPSFTPAVIASLETAEVCKLLLSVGEPMRNRMLSINLLEMTFDEIAMNGTGGAHPGSRG